MLSAALFNIPKFLAATESVAQTRSGQSASMYTSLSGTRKKQPPDGNFHIGISILAIPNGNVHMGNSIMAQIYLIVLIIILAHNQYIVWDGENLGA